MDASVWVPSERDLQGSNIASLMLRLGIADYPALHRFSVEERELFWSAVIARLGVQFRKRPDRILAQPCDLTHPLWLPGAAMNITDSCFSPLTPREKPAILWSRADGTVEKYSYADLSTLADWTARGLRALGVGPGERVGVIMPMTPVSVGIYLGIIRAGCVAVSIADSFAPPEIAVRLRIAGARLVVTMDVLHRLGKTIDLYERVCHAWSERVVAIPAGESFVRQHHGELGVKLRKGDVSGHDLMKEAGGFEPAVCGPGDPINILFSSGTTGDPKAIPWTHTSPIKCAADAMLHQDIHAEDVLCWPTTLGWMMGPWLIFATMMNRATMALYEDAPTTRGFAEFVSKTRVTMLGVVPSLVSHWRAKGTLDGIDWPSVRRYSSTGECSNPHDIHWLMTRTTKPRPVIEYCGGTELAGGYITSTMIHPNMPSTFSTPTLGTEMILLDEDGNETNNGEVFLVPPTIGMSTELLNADHAQVYYGRGRLRSHGDQIERLGPWRYRALGRTDDTMNLGGIKVSSAEIERLLNTVEGVRETAAIAVPPPGGGPDRLVVYAVSGRDAGQLKTDFQSVIHESLNPLFRVHDVVCVEGLPRTTSNKVMRRELRAIYTR